MFYSIPRYLEAPLDEGLRRDFEETFGLPLLSPPPGVMAELYRGGYRDLGHLNDRGRDRFTAWLAEAAR